MHSYIIKILARQTILANCETSLSLRNSVSQLHFTKCYYIPTDNAQETSGKNYGKSDILVSKCAFREPPLQNFRRHSCTVQYSNFSPGLFPINYPVWTAFLQSLLHVNYFDLMLCPSSIGFVLLIIHCCYVVLKILECEISSKQSSLATDWITHATNW